MTTAPTKENMAPIRLPESLHSLLEDNYSKWSDRPYVWTKSAKGYEHQTFGRLIEDSRALAAALLEQGLKDRPVMIYGGNSYEWMVADLALMGYVGIAVGANKDWSEYDLVNALEAVDVSALFYAEAGRAQIDKLRLAFPEMRYFTVEADLPKLVRRGRTILNRSPEYLAAHAQTADKICKIVFTTGTTAIPKAVPLNFANMMACGQALFARAPTDETDSYYLFLPLHHVYAAIDVFLYSFIVGAQIYICRNIGKMVSELGQIRPTVFCAVPLVYERIYAAIDAPTMSKIKKGIRLAGALHRIGIDIRPRLFKKLHEVFGGQMKYLFCGGANLDPRIKRLFNDVGLIFVEGYGMSETASLIALEHPGASLAGSVGKPFENLELKIDQPDSAGRGEILVKGGNVMRGYYHNPQANKDCFDGEGYFRTGDTGYLDTAGNLFLVGRKKRLIIRANGENVSPDELVQLILSQSADIIRTKVYESAGKLTAQLYIKQGSDLKVEDVIESTNLRLPKYKRIESQLVEYVDLLAQLK